MEVETGVRRVLQDSYRRAMRQPSPSPATPRGFGVLSTTGRKTGKRRRRCVRAIQEGNKVYLVSLRSRYGALFRNIQAEPHVTLRIRGGIFPALANEVTDPKEYEQAKTAYCGTLNPFDRLEHRAHRKGRPTPERIRALHEHWFWVGTPVVIDLSVKES